MKTKKSLSIILCLALILTLLPMTAFAGKDDGGPFDYTETGVYERMYTEWGDYNNRLNQVSVTLPASETGIEFSYLAVFNGEEYGTGPEMTPLPSGWTVDYLFTYCTVDLNEEGIPLTLPMAIPIGVDAATWAAAVNQYVDETYEAWSVEHPYESKWDYSIVCDYTPFLKEWEDRLTFTSSGELPLKTDAELYSGGSSVYSDRYYACIARFRRGGETVSFSSPYNAETFVDFSGPGSQDYTPSVLFEPAPLGEHEKSGSGNLTETLNATAVYGNKEMSYAWFRSDTGAEGTFTTIYGENGAFYDAPYPANENESTYYYATYRYTDDNNIPKEGKTTVAKLTRTASTNFTLEFVPDFIESTSPKKPDDFVLPQSLKNCTVTLSSVAYEFSDTFTVQNFTCEKKYNIPISSDYVVTVKNAEGNIIYNTKRVPFSGSGTVFTLGLDSISLMDLNVYLDGDIASLCPSLNAAGLHVSAWYCDYLYTPQGEPFASGVVDSDGYVDWEGYGREIPAKGYVLCKITDEVLETEDAKMYLNTDDYYHVQPYQIYAQPNAYVVTHGGAEQPVSAVTHAIGNYSVLTKSSAGTPLKGITVNFTAYGDNFTTVRADAVTDENGRCAVRMETLPQQRTATASIEKQTTPDGYTWNNYSVSLEPGVEKTVSMYGYTSNPLFELNVKVKSADGLTLTDYAESDYADTPLQLTVNGIPVVLDSNGKIHTEDVRLNMGDQMTVRGNVLRSELDALAGSVTGKFDINTSLELILEHVPVGTYSVCVQDNKYRPAQGIVVHFTCGGKDKAVLTDEEGRCSAQFLGDPASHTVNGYISLQKSADGSVWEGYRTETLTAGEEFLMISNVHFESPLIDLKVRVVNAGGETVPFEESIYKDVPLSLIINGKTASRSGSYYAASGLYLNYGDLLNFEASAALSPTEMVCGTVSVSFEGAKMTAEIMLYPQPIVTLNCLDYAGYPHEGTPRRVIIMTNYYPSKCLYDFVTTESAVSFCVPQGIGKSIMTAFTWDTAETDWQYAYAHAAQDGTHQSFTVPNQNTAHTLKGGFDPLGSDGSAFFVENGFNRKSLIALKSDELWSVTACATIYHSISRTAENLKDIFVLPEGAKEITVTQSGETANITVDPENRTVTVGYTDRPRSYTIINIYFDIPEEKLDADHSCTLESYVEYDYLGSHYTTALNSSVARADDMTISGKPDISIDALKANDYQLTVRLPAEGYRNVTVFDNNTKVKSIENLRSKCNFSVPLAAVTGEHEIRCEISDGSTTVTRTMTVNVLPNTRPVLQRLNVNGTDMTDGGSTLTYNASNSRFDVQAIYTHPEQIEKLWLVAETTAENYYLELTWDKASQSFKGYGELGSVHEPVYSVWLSKVEKWDPDTVVDYITYDDSLFTDILYFNETNLVPASEDPLQEQALADWEIYTELINNYHDSTDEETILAALHELFGDDNVWYTPAIYLSDGTVWRQAFHYDPEAVAAAKSSPDAITVNVNGEEVKSTVTVDPDAGTIAFAGCAGSQLPPVLKTADTPIKLMAAVSLGGVKDVIDGITVGVDIVTHWDDPINDDTADDWIRRVGSIPGAPPGVGDVGAGIHDMIRKRRDDADRARRGLPPRSPNGPGGPGGGGPTAPLIDPSGYIYEAVESNRIEGVSASLYYKDGENWTIWDSEAYGQSANPMLSLENGVYGWDVLPGTWKVVFEKDGYITAESEELPVPPPHLDVNISLVSEATPQVQSVTANDDGSEFTIAFDRYMKVSDVTADGAVSFTVGGAELTGTLTAVNAEAVKTGSKQAVGTTGLTKDEQVATVFTFAPNTAVKINTTVTVNVGTSVHAYNGKTLADTYSTSVTVTDENEFNGVVNITGLAEPVYMQNGTCEGTIIIALYDAHNRLLDIKTYEPAKNITAVLPESISYKTAKVMWWESITSLRPICEAVTVSAN